MKRAILILLLALTSASAARSMALQRDVIPPTVISEELQRVRYGYASDAMISALAAADTSSPATRGEASPPKPKSASKAFLLSLVVPGAGQFYYGNKIKAALFLGIEVTTLSLHFKNQNDGNNLTTQYQQFNAAHWSQNSYIEYLREAYNNPSINSDNDSSLLGMTEISHHLHPFGDGQYYEMTGKYNQFAWGWDDAVLGGKHLSDSVTGFVPPRVTGAGTVPQSANRDYYEGLRHDANNKFDVARAFTYWTILNHVVSAVEAYITTRIHNGSSHENTPVFSSNWHFDASLKSVYSRNDTPYMKVTYKF